jgi:hypothetical protein
MFAISAGSFALWAAQTLYANVSYEDDVKAVWNDAEVDVRGPRVSRARELGMYTMILIVFISFEGFAVKLFETVIKTGGSFAGLFSGVKSDDSDRFSTLRAEMTLIFALTSAVLWGTKAKQDAEGLNDGTLVSLWILFAVAAGGRAISFINVLTEKGINTLGGLFMDDKITRIFADENDDTKVTVPCLGAVISILLSFAAYTVYVFHGSDAKGFKFFGDEYVRFFQGFTFILLGVHVLLTILGAIPGVKVSSKAKAFHAGYIPVLRFGVSSIVLWSTGIAAGQEILSKANEQYALPAFLLYVSYDILSKGKF